MKTCILLLSFSCFLVVFGDIFEIKLPRAKGGGYLAPPPLPVGCSTEYLRYTQQVCLPTHDRRCRRETRVKLTPRNMKKCVRVSVPKCRVVKREVSMRVCGRYYEQVVKTESVTGVSVDYAERCEFRNKTVCPYHLPYHYPKRYFPPRAHRHHCRDENGRVCFKVPIPRPYESHVYLPHPEAKDNCTELTTEVPRVTCKDEEEDESFCYETLELDSGQQEVEECEVSFKEEDGEKLREVCRQVGFKVPKTVCKDRPEQFIEYDEKKK